MCSKTRRTVRTFLFFRAAEQAKRRASFEINITKESILSTERQLRRKVRKNYATENAQPQQRKSPAGSAGDKKFWCPVCKQGFTRKYNLKVNTCSMIHTEQHGNFETMPLYLHTHIDSWTNYLSYF